MPKKIVNGIEFTHSEIEILACFTVNSGKPSTIARILDKTNSAIYKHLDRIKLKLNAQSIDDVELFIKKGKGLKKLREIFKKLYIDFYFRETAKKIAYKLKPLNIECYFSSSSKLATDEIAAEIISAIELTGIKVNKIDNLGSFLKSFSSLDSQQFGLCVVDNIDEIKDFQATTLDKQQFFYLCLNKPTNRTQIPKKAKILYFEQDNKKSFYSFLVNHLIENYQMLDKESEITNFLPEIENIAKNIKSGTFVSITNLSEYNKQLAWFLSIRKPRTIIFLMFSGIILFFLWHSFLNTSKNKNIKKETNVIGSQALSSNGENTKQSEFNLPRILGHYVKREFLTKAIWHKLTHNAEKRKAAVLVGLHGLGGVGKTTLAANLIHNPKGTYSFRGWFRSETKELLITDYLILGDKLQLFNEDMTNNKKIQLVKDWLEKKESSLLVYDNASDIESIKNYLPNKGHLIITSRNYKLPSALEIDVMTESEALSLLDKLIPQIIKESNEHIMQANKLVKTLDYLPLAISQAGAYISENLMPVSEYLSIYQVEKEILLSKKIMPIGDTHQPAYVTWNMSLAKIKQHPDAQKALELLNFLGYYYPESIPKKLLIQCLYGNSNSHFKLKFNDAVNLLRKYSFIKLMPSSVSIHRIVQEWIRHTKSKEEEIFITKQVMFAIEAIYPWGKKSLEDNIFINVLLPHIEKILIYVQNNSLETYKFLHLIGDFYNYLGRYKKTLLLLKGVATNIEKNGNFNYEEKIYMLYEKGLSYYNMGEYELAKKHYQIALDAANKYKALRNINTSNILHGLGKVSYTLGEYKEAMINFKKALSIQELYKGERHIGAAYIIQNIGDVYCRLGNYKQSKEHYLKAVSILTHKFGKYSINATNALQKLGNIYFIEGNYLLAKQKFEKVLLIRNKHYGQQHIKTTFSLQGLGDVYLRLGDYDKAKNHYEKVLAIREKHYGLQHIEVTHSWQRLGDVYHKLGDYDRAKSYFEDALPIRIKHYGKNHVKLAYSWQRIGNVYFCMGDYKKAENCYHKSLIIRKNHNSTLHVSVSHIMQRLGDLHHALGHHAKAKKYFSNSLDIRKKYYGKNHMEITHSLQGLGKIYYSQGKYKKSKNYFKKALAIRKKHFGGNHIEIASTYNYLGYVEFRLNDIKSSLIYADHALNNIKKAKHSSTILLAHNYLLRYLIYSKKSQISKSANYLNTSVSLFKKIYGKHFYEAMKNNADIVKHNHSKELAHDKNL